jgi:hypothetical protein
MTLVIKPENIIEKISNKKTGEIYENEEALKAANIAPEGYSQKSSKKDVTGYKACLNNLAKL